MNTMTRFIFIYKVVPMAAVLLASVAFYAGYNLDYYPKILGAICIAIIFIAGLIAIDGIFSADEWFWNK